MHEREASSEPERRLDRDGRLPEPGIAALQRAAGNHAVASLLARQPTGAAADEAAPTEVPQRIPSALESMWGTGVTSHIRAAGESLDRRRLTAASGSLNDAMTMLVGVRRSYVETDPTLGYQVAGLYNGISAAKTAIDAHRGVRWQMSTIRESLTSLASRADELGPQLH
jgi:hypothetical protein